MEDGAYVLQTRCENVGSRNELGERCIEDAESLGDPE